MICRVAGSRGFGSHMSPRALMKGHIMTTSLDAARRFWRADRDHPDNNPNVGPVMLAVLKTVAAEKETK